MARGAAEAGASVVVLLLAVVAHQLPAQAQVVIDGTNSMPRLPDGEVVQVFFLENPPFNFPTLDETVSSFQAWSGGVGFRQLRAVTTSTAVSGAQTTSTVVSASSLQYAAQAGLGAAVFPTVTNGSTGPSVRQTTAAHVVYRTDISSATWARSQYMGTISGAIYNNYACWVDAFVTHVPAYQLLEVLNSRTGHTILAPSTGSHFALESANVLFNLGAALDPVVPLTMFQATLYTDGQQLQTVEFAAARAEIAHFFSAWEGLGLALSNASGVTLERTVETWLSTLSPRTAYVPADSTGTQYLVVPLSAPFLALSYNKKAIPAHATRVAPPQLPSTVGCSFAAVNEDAAPMFNLCSHDRNIVNIAVILSVLLVLSLGANLYAWLNIPRSCVLPFDKEKECIAMQQRTLSTRLLDSQPAHPLG